MEISKRKVLYTIITLVIILLIISLKITQYPALSTQVNKSVNQVRIYPSLPEQFGITGTNITFPVKSSCPDIIEGMMKGKWKNRPLTSTERTEIEIFLDSVRTSHGMPKSMQRVDNKCGSVSYEKLFWFRALCNPKGPTPCCYDGMCIDKSSDKCHCANCYDLRTQIHAEYSTWEPEDSRCQVKNFTDTEACHLLQGTQLVVVGDSLMRHLYTALLLVLSNNGFDGAFPSNLPKEIHDQCTGMYTFTERVCRVHIRTPASFCNKTVNVSLETITYMAEHERFVSLIQSLHNKPNTFVLFSIGPYDNYDNAVYNKFILPGIEAIENNDYPWPKLIWATTHMFGILKTPMVPKQGWENVRIFNCFIIDKLQQHKLPVLDTFNLTAGVMSPDGAHFGVGINMMKIQMFFNLFEELKRTKRWYPPWERVQKLDDGYKP